MAKSKIGKQIAAMMSNDPNKEYGHIKPPPGMNKTERTNFRQWAGSQMDAAAKKMKKTKHPWSKRDPDQDEDDRASANYELWSEMAKPKSKQSKKKLANAEDRRDTAANRLHASKKGKK